MPSCSHQRPKLTLPLICTHVSSKSTKNMSQIYLWWDSTEHLGSLLKLRFLLRVSPSDVNLVLCRIFQYESHFFRELPATLSAVKAAVEGVTLHKQRYKTTLWANCIMNFTIHPFSITTSPALSSGVDPAVPAGGRSRPVSEPR